MFSNWVNDDEVTEYMSWEPHGTIDITKEAPFALKPDKMVLCHCYEIKNPN